MRNNKVDLDDVHNVKERNSQEIFAGKNKRPSLAGIVHNRLGTDSLTFINSDILDFFFNSRQDFKNRLLWKSEQKIDNTSLSKKKSAKNSDEIETHLAWKEL